MTTNDSLQQQMIGILEEQIELTLEDLCRACAVHTDIIIELVDEGVLEAAGTSPREWRFDGRNIRRARVALRLQHDLGVNLAGAALALQLMEEIETLRSRLRAIRGE
jgi:chaperone modulatory protein CbpM